MKEFTQEQIVGINEAYRFYKLLPYVARTKVPKHIIKTMKDVYQKDICYEYKDIQEFINKDVSDEGGKLIAYISLYI